MSITHALRVLRVLLHFLLLMCLQAEFYDFMQKVRGNITALRTLEAANPGSVKDIPLSTVYLQWVNNNKGTWAPEQYQVANAIMHTQFQVSI